MRDEHPGAIAVVGLAASGPAGLDVESFWAGLMTGVPAPSAAPTPAPTLAQIVGAAVADAGHDPAVADPFGDRRVATVATVTAAVAALRSGECAVAIVADLDVTAAVVVLRPWADAVMDRDDVRALLGDDPAEAVRIAVGPTGVTDVVAAVLALQREVLPYPDRLPRSWPRARTPGRPRRALVARAEGEMVVLVEAPAVPLRVPDARARVLTWTGATEADERAARARLAQFLVLRGEAVFAEAAGTPPGSGRVRAAAVCADALDATGVLGAVESDRVHVGRGGVGHSGVGHGDVGVGDTDAAGPGAAPRSVALHVVAHPVDPGTPPAFAAAKALALWRAALGGRPASAEVWGIALAAASTRALLAAGARPPALVASGAGFVAAAVAADALEPAAALQLLGAPPDSERVRRAMGDRVPAVPLRGPGGGSPTVLVDGRTEEALLDTAARLWVAGEDIDWAALGQPAAARRIPLPAPSLPPLLAGAATVTGAPLRRAPRPPTGVGWVEVLDPGTSGRTVLALPYAGGSGRAFRPLRRHLPSGCGLAVVDIPGHGRLMDEPCLTSVEDVLIGLQSAVAALEPRELVLLGYSLGGSFAHELAARLCAAGDPPAGLVVCGTRAPHTGVGHLPVAQAPAGTPFLTAATAVQLAARELLEMPDLAEAFAGPLHADLAMVESFPFRRRAPLAVPTCVVGFRSDWLVPEPTLRAWDDLCASPPLQLRTDGGHLALHERPEEFCTAVAAALDHVRAVRLDPAV